MITNKLQCSDGKLFDASQQKEAEQHETYITITEHITEQLNNKISVIGFDDDDRELIVRFIIREHDFIFNLLTPLQ